MAEREVDVLRRLIEFLIEHGYPARSIVAEHRIGKYRPDVVVLEPASNKPVAIFEIKRLARRSLRMAVEQLAAYQLAVGEDVPLYVVTPDEERGGIRILRWTGDSRTPFEEAPLPNFTLLANKFLLEAVNKNRTNRKATVDLLWLISWILAALVGLLFLLHLAGEIRLDSTDLALLGLFVGLVILPFAGKLKVLGFEYEALRPGPSK